MLCSLACLVLFTGAGSSVMLRSREPPVNIGLSDPTAAGSSVMLCSREPAVFGYLLA